MPEVIARAPPRGVRPFGIVTQTPDPATPAGKAGLTLGDALLSFGTARHLRDVQSVLASSVGTPVAVLVVDNAGRYVRKFVVPAQWDPSAPKSLLGCQMSNQCPADHPAIVGVARPARRVLHEPPSRTAPDRTKSSSTSSPPLQSPERACCAKCLLIVASLLQLCLVVAIIGLPSVSPGAADLLRLARLDCSTSGSTPPTNVATRISRNATTAGRRLLEDATSTAAATALPASAAAATSVALNPSPEPLPALAPYGSSPPNAPATVTSPPSPSPVPLSSPPPLRESPPPVSAAASVAASLDVPMALATPASRATSPASEPGQAADTKPLVTKSVAVRAARSPSSPAPAAVTATEPTSGAATSLARLDYAGVGLLTRPAATGAITLLTGLQLDGQLDVDDLVLGILVACTVLGLISLLGLVVACSHPTSCTRTISSTLYFVTSLPVWVALGFAVASCFLFRAEAEALVRRYWLCLLLTEPAHLGGAAQTAWGAASAVYQSITLVACLLIAANVLLLAGLYSATKVVGSGIVAAYLLNVVNLGQMIVGGGLCAVATGLHARSDGGGGGLQADAVLLVLGGGVLAMSLLGLLAARLYSRCLLRLYLWLATLVTLGLLAFVGGLTVIQYTPQGMSMVTNSAFLAANWHYVRDVYPISKEDFLRLLLRHYTKLAIAGGLLLIVQLVVLVATCALRSALARPGRKESATTSERAGLMYDDDDDDDDEQMV